MYYIGIDPGSKGAIVVLSSRGGLHDIHILRKTSRYSLLHFFRFKVPYSTYSLYIEKVGGFIADNEEKRNIASAHTMFKFGQEYERLIMAMEAPKIASITINYKEILPKEWQKFYGIKREKGETKSQFKNRLKALARHKSGSKRITLETADAYLIALYCYHKEKLDE